MVNCHILFNKNRGDIKFFQIVLIQKAITLIVNRHGTESRPVSVIWGGDFNVLPCSPLYNYLRKGTIEDLQTYSSNQWTGQHQCHNIHTKLQSGMAGKLSKLNEFFSQSKHGKYLFAEPNTMAFATLVKRLNECNLNICPEKCVIELCYSSDLGQVMDIKKQSHALGSIDPAEEMKRFKIDALETIRKANLGIPALRSAYGEDHNSRGSIQGNYYSSKGQSSAVTGEMNYSAFPVQEGFPFTVDYIL